MSDPPVESPARPARPSVLREARSVPTVLLVVGILAVGLPLVVLLTPNRHVEVFGQDITVGARTPDLSLSGPAQIVQLGNTAFDLRGTDVYGPLRPQLSIGPLQRGPKALAAFGPDAAVDANRATSTLTDAFLTWYLWGAVGMVLVALAGSGVVGCIRLLVALRERDGSTAVLAGGHTGRIVRMTVIAIVASLLFWLLAGLAAVHGTTEGLRRVSSLSDLVGATAVTPPPVGPPVFGYRGAVIGDSRAARVGGPALPDATGQDTACDRSADSPAAEIESLSGEPVLNLACSGASIPSGLRGPQRRGETEVPAQVSRLKQVRGLDWVVVAVGPNDVNWSDFLLYCYGLPSCDDRLSAGEFGLRMASFARDYAALLDDLDALPDKPRVIVTTSYDPFPPDPDPACPDLRGPPGAAGLDQAKVDLLSGRNDRLNAVLTDGADRYGFAVVDPALTPLCAVAGDGLGPDLQGLGDRHPFHPTALGSLRLAAGMAAAVRASAPPAGPG